MPIRLFLEGQAFDPETIRIMSEALESVCERMGLHVVDDDATRIWMRALYQNRLEKHLSTAESVHAASLSLLRERRARGQSSHPFYWAGFVAAGDWQ